MGLDMVEVILAVEDEFEVHLDDHWNEMRTVGDLHRVICMQLNEQQQCEHATCPSIAPFFATRDALVAITSADSRIVRPSTPLSAIIDGSRRRKTWTQLQSLAHIQLPSLTRPALLVNLLQVTAASLLLVTTVLASGAFRESGMFVLLCTSIAWIAVAYFSTRSFAIAFPGTCQTVGDVVRHARAPMYPVQRSKPIENTNNVWHKLSAIVSDRLDTPLAEITPDARFIEDLKCD